MRRLVIFASYCDDGVISEYILYYLRCLKDVADNIVFVADNDMVAGEVDKLDGLVTHCICKRHGCYDFGSYRRGFEFAETNNLLEDIDELIFCNDSCYGSIYPFKNIFSEMDKRNCDFWGMVESHEVKVHLQSYFLVFKKNVFCSDIFRDYVYSFEKQDDFWNYVVKYETNFAEHLVNAGFSYSAYIDSLKYDELNNGGAINPTIFPVMLIYDGMPLLKRKVFSYQYSSVLRDSIVDVINVIRSINNELYEIILRDIGNDIMKMQRLVDDCIFRKNKSFKLENIIQFIDNLVQHKIDHNKLNVDKFNDNFDTYKNILFEGICNGILLCGNRIEK